MDFAPLIDYWQGEKRVYHHTAPVNALYGLAESLAIVLEEGMPATWQRHRQAHEALAAGLQAMGLKMAVPAAERAPQLNAVEIPDGVDDASIRSSLLDQFGLEIGAGLGPLAGRIWRIGLMGQSATLENVQFCLSSLSSALEAQGHAVDASGAQRAAAAVG
jgi:alanine-glyoxylate transaminase/serine-glyoxylate transaminase/serine-pyruvate transaminase